MQKLVSAIPRLVFAASLLFCGHLCAQLDPRLQADKTSFLDLYQQSTTIKPKPEIVTVFDFSGSMDALMFHPLYQNLDAEDDTNSSITTTIYIWLKASGSWDKTKQPWDNLIKAGSSTSSDTVTLSLLRSGSTTAYDTTTQLTLAFRGLVKPNGDPVTYEDAEACTAGLKSENGTTIVPASSKGMYSGTSTSGRDVRHWLMAASHVRFECTAAETGIPDRSKVVGRTIDIPLPWKVMDYNSTGNPLKSKTIKDVQIKTTKDQNGKDVTTTYGSGLDIEFDTTYRIPYAFRSSAGTLTSSANYIGKFSYTSSTGGGSIAIVCNTSGYPIGYKTSYLHWLFAGRWQNSVDGPTPNASKDNYHIAANGQYYTNDTGMAGKFIAFDAAAPSGSALLAAGQTSADWGKGFRGQIENPAMRDVKIRVPKYKLNGKLDKIIEDYAYRYATPALTRVQANKMAAIQTWIKHQADVFWAFRYLDRAIANSNTNQYLNKTMHGSTQTGKTSFNVSTLMTSTSPAEWVTGMDHGWQVLNNTNNQGINSTNGNSVTGMKRLAATFAVTSTPLTYAMAGTLAQLNDGENPFNDLYKPNEVSQCSQTFLILFTDGVDNVGSPTAATPYIDSPNPDFDKAAFNAVLGNRAVINNKAGIETTWFNVQTYAALGAHMTDASLGIKNIDYIPDALAQTTGSTRKNIRDFLPFAIKGRQNVTYRVPRRVTTMTVGVSLGGRTTDFSTAVNPKRGLFLAAVMGDVGVSSGALNTFRPFTPPTFKSDGKTVENYNDWLEDPSNPESYPTVGKRATGAAYFFDATDPNSLANSLETAFQAAISAGSNNATSTPSIPFVGASFGGQVYMGNFDVPDGGNAVWTGDLFMFGLREENGQAKILGKNGVPTQNLDSTTAIWSASSVIKNWKERKLYTRLPKANDYDPLKPFTDVGDHFANATTGLKNYIKLPDPTIPEPDKTKAKIVQFAAGGDTLRGVLDGNGRPTTNRSTIMGDIIDSAPEAIEYHWDLVKNDLAKYPDLMAVSGSNLQFRLILVGTNQGWLHAFGEVSTKATSADGKEYVTGNVAELWSFMPTDFLENLDYITRPGNIHRFMVNGTPVIYHLDIPSKADGIGDGIVNLDSNGHVERVLAVFGLGKGGRSYYALNIENPFEPKIQWTLIPDEAGDVKAFPDSRIEVGADVTAANVRKMLGKWGFSTAAPAFGRVIFNGSSGKQLKDAVFFSGGFSVPEVEAKFVDSYGKPIGPLGRSIMALDVYTGKVIAAVDLSADPIFGSSVGPIGSGLIPFEFIINSGTAQRAYFLDYSGGLWAWGSLDTERSDPYRNFRIDTSEINQWKLRKVYQDTSAVANRKYTVSAAPFRVSNFPGEGMDGSAKPPAVGIAMVSGDRNNPLDRYGGEYSPGPQPNNHRLTVVFDRQDSNAWLSSAGIQDGVITDGALRNFTNNEVSATPANFCADSIFKYITPGCDDFYLAPKQGSPSFGYYINFPAKDGGFTPKGINPPMVVSDSLYYTIFFTESADPCSGGLGVSRSYVIADVTNPLKQDSRGSTEGERFASGLIGEWGGVGSDFIQMGTRGVLQGGTALGGSGGGIELKTTTAKPAEGFPKPRVWRVVK